MSCRPDKLLHYRADTMDDLGAAYRMFGRYEDALQMFSDTLALQQRIDDRQGVGRSLRRASATPPTGLGELDLATQCLEQALPIARQTNDGRNQEGTLRNLGNVAFLRADFSSALGLHRQALASAASETDRAHLQLLIAKDLVALGQPDEAETVARDVRKRAQGLGSQSLLAGALLELGRAERGMSRSSASMTLEHAASLYDTLGLVGPQADALELLALTARDAGRRRRAVDYGNAALGLLGERPSAQVRDAELADSSWRLQPRLYETQIDLVMGLDAADASTGERERAALETDERRRARMIADLLHEASVNPTPHGSRELEQRRTHLYDRLAQLSRRRDLLDRGRGCGRRRSASCPMSSPTSPRSRTS